MNRKKKLIWTCIGLAVIALLIPVIKVSGSCAAVLYCPNGNVIWCETFGSCPVDTCSTGFEYVYCYCSMTSYVYVSCYSGAKTPLPPVN
ncbi:MAG: hypothetical protein QG657_2892 [Acidobacteriota bacterium]|nr:hypothetical protein [Acidobacteriota bacterium]